MMKRLPELLALGVLCLVGDLNTLKQQTRQNTYMLPSLFPHHFHALVGREACSWWCKPVSTRMRTVVIGPGTTEETNASSSWSAEEYIDVFTYGRLVSDKDGRGLGCMKGGFHRRRIKPLMQESLVALNWAQLLSCLLLSELPMDQWSRRDVLSPLPCHYPPRGLVYITACFKHWGLRATLATKRANRIREAYQATVIVAAIVGYLDTPYLSPRMSAISPRAIF